MMPLIYTTSDGIGIHTFQGNKGACDFIVKYDGPKGRQRTPKHIHMAADLLIKRAMNPALTNALLDHIVNNICKRVRPIASNPPNLQIFSPLHIQQFSPLNGLGGYSIEFLLVVIELIQTQEITNYPSGVGHYALYESIKDGEDIYSIIGAATQKW